MPTYDSIPQPPPSREEKFVANLDAAIAFHRTNQNDPYSIGNAVICSLTETRHAFAKAYGYALDSRPAPESSPR